MVGGTDFGMQKRCRRKPKQTEGRLPTRGGRLGEGPTAWEGEGSLRLPEYRRVGNLEGRGWRGGRRRKAERGCWVPPRGRAVQGPSEATGQRGGGWGWQAPRGEGGDGSTVWVREITRNGEQERMFGWDVRFGVDKFRWLVRKKKTTCPPGGVGYGGWRLGLPIVGCLIIWSGVLRK